MFESWPVAAGLLNLPSLWGWFCVLLVSVFGFHLILEDRPRSVTDENLITHHITEDFVGFTLNPQTYGGRRPFAKVPHPRSPMERAEPSTCCPESQKGDNIKLHVCSLHLKCCFTIALAL